MTKLVEIKNHFVDESTGVSGYVAGGTVYLNLDGEAVTREQFIKTAIRYVGFSTSKEKLKEYTDIYDEANDLFGDVDKKVVDKSLLGVGIPAEASETGDVLGISENAEDSVVVKTPQKPTRRRTSSRNKTK